MLYVAIHCVPLKVTFVSVFNVFALPGVGMMPLQSETCTPSPIVANAACEKDIMVSTTSNTVATRVLVFINRPLRRVPGSPAEWATTCGRGSSGDVGHRG